MKFCYACGHETGGEPLFCNSCGRSYDVKLCPKLHPNPRTAEACSQCGSRDLSVPQPRVPILWRLMALLIQATSGLLLLSLSLPVVATFLDDPSKGSDHPERLLGGIFILVVLWSFWIVLPGVFRRIFHRSLIQKSGSRKGQNGS